MQDILSITKETLKHLGVEYSSVELHEVAGTTFVSVASPQRDFLDQGAEKLKSLNSIVRLIAEKRQNLSKFTIDFNDYFKNEVEKLMGVAKMLAERARSLRYDVEMDPMRAFDRMVVHAALTGEKDVKTESVGLGKERRVVIKYTGGSN